MSESSQQLLRQLPAIDRLLGLAAVASHPAPHVLKRGAAQQLVADLRRQLLTAAAGALPTDNELADRLLRLIDQRCRPSLRRVLNASGTLLHTNLGRAPLSGQALQAITEVAKGYSNLELDLTSGTRGHRYSHIDQLLCQLTGAEAAAVVNNNAGAVLLALTALAQGREALVSRGELVEIGGAFRIPDVMEAGGVRLREVGTTNKTHLRDYQSAIGEHTGLLLKVHTSNYRIVGFSQSVEATELVGLGRQHGIPVMEDLGSGMLLDLSPFGLPREPTVQEAVAAGIDVLTFSGDKLLGGPQAGLIVGKRWAIDKIRHHPLARALRIDKLTLAALEATLFAYLDREQALHDIPVLRMLNLPAEQLRQRSQRFLRRLRRSLPADQARLQLVEACACVGGGALPLTELPGCALALQPLQQSAAELARRLRDGTPAVVGRLQDAAVLLNLRCIAADEETALLQALCQALQSATVANAFAPTDVS